MAALALSSLVVFVQIVGAILLPGMLLEIQFRRLHLGSSAAGAMLTRVLGFGSICLTLQFLVFYGFVVYLKVPAALAVGMKCACDLTVLGVLLLFQRQEFLQGMRVFCSAAKDPTCLVMLIVATGYGLFGMIGAPYGLDNAATGWTVRFINGEMISLTDSQGSPAFISLIYFPGLVLRGMIPLPTLVAGLKVPLSLLTALSVRRLVLQLPFKQYSGALSVAFQLMVMCSFFGLYGQFETAKESALGIALLMLFVAELFQERDREDTWALCCGLPLAAAFGFGAITIPYAGMITALFLLFSMGRVKPLGFVWPLILVTAIPLIPSINAMTRIRYWQAATALILLGAICYALRRVQVKLPSSIGSDRARSLAAAMMLVACMVAVYCLLPVRYTVSYPPLDGKTGFWQLLSINGHDRLVVLGILGLAASFLRRGFAGNAGLHVLAVFPFACLVPTLFIAHHPEWSLPFHPQHLWDLAKDVPNWCYGFYYGLFSLVAVSGIATWCDASLRSKSLTARRPSLSLGVILVSVFVFLSVGNSVKTTKGILKRPGFPPYFTTVGGHHDPVFARIVERIYLAEAHGEGRQPGQPVFVSAASRLNAKRVDFSMYGIHVEDNLDLTQAADSERLADQLPVCLIAPVEQVEKWEGSRALGLAVEELLRGEDQEGLFLISRANQDRLTTQASRTAADSNRQFLRSVR